jgi:hypothetical protein
MKKLIYFITFILLNLSLHANEKTPWSHDYQNKLIEKVAQKVVTLSTYPSLEYPNHGADQILKKYPDKKVLLFGYGSLINADSAARSVSPEAVQSMRPVIAFGFKRIFNYKAGNVSRWGANLPQNEKAMLNIEPTTTYNPIINGIVMEVSPSDLAQLIERETGYDLAPALVADWNEVISENPNVSIQVAYTFLVPDELRQGVDYTQTRYYPVLGYMHAVQEGSAVFGTKFLDYWNATTYLSDGTTSITKWDGNTFSGILDTKEP